MKFPVPHRLGQLAGPDLGKPGVHSQAIRGKSGGAPWRVWSWVRGSPVTASEHVRRRPSGAESAYGRLLCVLGHFPLAVLTQCNARASIEDALINLLSLTLPVH